MDPKKDTIRPYTYFFRRVNNNLVYIFLYDNKRHHNSCKTQESTRRLDQILQLLPGD